MRHRVSLQHLTVGRQCRLELIEQPRLAGARLGHDRDDLPVTAPRQFERALHLRKFALAPDELRQPPPRRELEMAPQRPGAHHLVHVDRLADSL